MRRCYEQVRAEVAVVSAYAVQWVLVVMILQRGRNAVGGRAYRGVVILVVGMVGRELATDVCYDMQSIAANV